MLKQTTSSQRVRFVGSPTKERFIKELRRRVDAYFSENNISQYANGEMYLKTIIAIVAWITVYVNIVNGVFTTNVWLLLLGYMILGYVNIFIAFNIMHDATHEAYSPSKRVNKILGYSMDFIGGNQYLFRAMHGAHHGFVNIRGIDVTLETHGMFRFSPDEPWLPRHRWQHYYTFVLYALAMLQWTTMKDFKWFFGEGHIGNKKNISHPMQEYVTLLIGKAIYYGLTLVLPLILIPLPWYSVLGGWVFMHILPGLTFALIFQVTHVYEGTTYPLPDEDGNIDNNYALHVLETTADFSRHSKVATWLMGGINIHVIHHIFPKVCHVHYAELTKILKELCDEFGIEYQDNPNFWVALRKHYLMLKHLSRPDAEVPRIGKSAAIF